jgi:hypothetical protein
MLAHPLLLLLSALPAQDPALAAPSPYRVSHEEVENGHVLKVGGAPFTTLRLDRRVPVLYPLVGPSGQPMTRGYPLEERPHEAKDHPHHQSMWFAHGSVNGLDFWHDEAVRIVPSGKPAVFQRGDDVSISHAFLWQGKAGETVLSESRLYTFHAQEAARWVDVRLALTADAGDVVFGDTKEGTFALRLCPELRLKGEVAVGSIRDSEGHEDGACWGKRAKWMQYFGEVEGKHVGVAVFDHADNLRHPTWWHARDYGLVAANPFGVHDFERKPAGTGDYTLEKGETLTLRYRVLLHEGPRGKEQLDASYEHYLETSADAERR